MDLKSKLEPFYIKKLPVKDPWGNDYLYVYGGKHGDEYSIGSAGRDGVFKGWHQSGTFPMDQIENFNNDIIFSNGKFTFCPKIKSMGQVIYFLGHFRGQMPKVPY